jgi:acetylornithine deacetylase
MNDDIRNKVLTEVDSLKEELISLICEAITIPSVNATLAAYTGESEKYAGYESMMSRFISDYLEKIGLEVDVFEKAPGRENAVGTYRGMDGGKSLIFNGHTDVVLPGDINTWKVTKPFEPKVIDGKIYGRGSCDMKSGLLAAVIALKAVLNSGFKPKGDVKIAAVVGEEQMEHEIGTTATIERGHTADAAIVCEPSQPYNRLGIVPACLTSALLHMVIKGRSTHGSLRAECIRPGGLGAEMGVSSIDKSILIYNGLKMLEDEWGQTKTHPLYKNGHFTINCGVITGGPEGPAAISGESTMQYTIWGAPYETENSLKTEIKEHIAATCRLDPWLREHPPEISWPLFWPSYNLPTDAPICTALAKGYEEALKEKAKFHGFCGNSDASFYNLAGIPAVSIGPGNLIVAHGPDEYVEIDEVVDAAKVYAMTIIEWNSNCSSKP